MDSIFDRTEVVKMERSYKRFLRNEDTIEFGTTRHNLMEDFEETPVKRAKGTTDKGSSSSFSECSEQKKQLMARDADIIQLKASITKMEARLATMESSARESRIEYDKEIMKLRTEKDREVIKSTELRSKLQYVMEKEKNSREEIHRLEEELKSKTSEMEKKLLDVQKEKIDIADKAHKAKSDWLEKQGELHSKMMQQMQMISDLKTKLDEAESQLKHQNRLLENSHEQKQEINKLKTSLLEEQRKNKELEKKLSDHEDNLVITRAFKKDLDQLDNMKQELEKLRLENEQLRYNEQNTLLLEEEVISLKKKLKGLSGTQERLIELEIENEELQGRLSRWEASDTSGSRRPRSPCSLSRQIQELEMSQAQMVLAHGELETSLHRKQIELDRALDENHRLSAQLTAEKNATSQINVISKHLKRKLLLVTRERDSIQNLLDSYENEVTLNFDAEKVAQIQRLESILHGYKEHNTELETELTSLTEKLSLAQNQSFQHQQQLDSVTTTTNKKDQDLIRQQRERIAELETVLTTIEQEKNILEARIEQRHLQGDYDPSKTKIVHLKLNPFAVAQKARVEELERLREENERLRKRNQILEEKGGQVEDLTIQVQERLQHPSPSKELEELKGQLQREEMRNKRLMEVFKKTSQEFREACYQLTGYKIDIPCSNQYRLTSMYAESQRDYFLFQKNSQGEIQMLQTDFSLTVKDSMELYLQTHNSIPMFLSSITMTLFSRQTMNLG